MLNLWLGGLVCLCCIFVGWFVRVRYRKRVDVADDLMQLVVYIEERIQYDMASLPTIFASFADMHATSSLAAACKDYPVIGEVALAKGQWQEIKDLLASLGRSDLTGQKGRLSYVKARFGAMQNQAHADLAKKGNLYAKLWVVLGVGLMIWMV